MSQPGLRHGRGVSESESVRCQQCPGLGHLDCDGRGVSKSESVSIQGGIDPDSLSHQSDNALGKTCARFGTKQVLLPDKLADCLPG